MKKVIAITTTILLFLILFLVYFNTHFMPGFEINGKNVGFLNVEKTTNKILQTEGKIILKEKNKPDIELEQKDYIKINCSQEDIKYILQKNKYKVDSIDVDFEKDLDFSSFEDEIKKYNKNRTPSTDAYLDFDNEKYTYVIVPETYGNSIDTVELTRCVLEGENYEVNLEEFYVKPVVLSDDKALISKLEEGNKIYSAEITYELLDNETLVLNSSIYGPWIEETDGEFSINEKELNNFVDEIANKVNTVGITRTFDAHNGEVEVSGGSYGWKVDKEKEIESLKAEILSGKKTTRRPYFSQEAQEYSKNDIGNTYVEVDIDNQHLYFVQDGEVVFDSDIVTGMLKDSSRRTTTGVHFIWSMDKERYLNGPTWHVFVNRFMPFCGGQGFHDATWRGSFGGNIYKTDGSHGCVNLPKENAIKLYDLAYIGCPVVIYSSNY